MLPENQNNLFYSNNICNCKKCNCCKIQKESPLDSLLCVESFLCNFQKGCAIWKIYNFLK